MKLTVSACLLEMALGHGNMINPRPRSSHSQTFDEANKCGSKHPYSNATQPGNYCGLGCLGEACLYYQIGCFQGCGTCSLSGKTLYPVPSDVTLAGCDADKLPEPTLGGGNATHEHEMRSYNIDNQSWKGDWTKWMPWRSPGLAGKGNPKFQPCGVNSGALASQPEPPTSTHDVANGAPGTLLSMLPKQEWSTWKAGSVVEAEWAIYANHGGGYNYRICKYDGDGSLTEECYQKTPLEFATPETEIRYKDNSKAPFNITSPTTNVGTFPAGSQWRKSPVPMCNCDIGINCGGKGDEVAVQEAQKRVADYSFEAMVRGGKPSGCTPVTRANCGIDYTDNCMKCGNSSAWDCEECCPGCTMAKKGDYAYCQCGKGPSPGKQGMYTSYKNSHFRPGQTSDLCPSGVQFPTFWDEGAGAGVVGKGFGGFMFTMVDYLKVPADLPAGQYSVSWRWDCEETPQVWNSCADISVVA